MSKKELSKVKAFKENYSDFCKGKSDECILVSIRFIEATRKEIKTQAKHQRDFLDVLDVELTRTM